MSTSFGLRDQCIVPWDDGTYYAGKIIKILDPFDGCLHEDLGSHSKKPREATQTFKLLRRRKSSSVKSSLIDQCEASGELLYYIHFRGWRADTDEWLDASRMLPHTPENVEMMQTANAEIKKQRLLEKENEKLARQVKPGSKQPAKPSSSAKRKAADDELDKKKAKTLKQERDEPDTGNAKRSIRKSKIGLGPAVVDLKLQLPLKLKRLLVSDWQLITQECLLVQLPRKISVVQILREFREHQINSKLNLETQVKHELGLQSNAELDPLNGDLENLGMFVQSMTTYFDYALGFLLLYRYERNQYYNVLHTTKNMKPSTVYGGEHLLRLIISMPSILAKDTVIDDITITYVLKQLNLLINFVAENSTRFLGSITTYESPSRFYEAMSSGANDEELQRANDVNV